MTTIQATNANPAFTSNLKKDYDKRYDNSGLKVGAAVTACALPAVFVQPAYDMGIKQIIRVIRKNAATKSDMYAQADFLFDVRKAYKKIMTPKMILKNLAFAIPIYLGAGAVVDYFNNKQRKENEPNAITKNGNEYTKVNMGKKLGLILGAAAQIGLMAVQPKRMKRVDMLSPNPKLTKAISTGIGAVGGFILGAITDHNANKKAAKEADKIAQQYAE